MAYFFKNIYFYTSEAPFNCDKERYHVQLRCNKEYFSHCFLLSLQQKAVSPDLLVLSFSSEFNYKESPGTLFT